MRRKGKIGGRASRKRNVAAAAAAAAAEPAGAPAAQPGGGGQKSARGPTGACRKMYPDVPPRRRCGILSVDRVRLPPDIGLVVRPDNTVKLQAIQPAADAAAGADCRPDTDAGADEDCDWDPNEDNDDDDDDYDGDGHTDAESGRSGSSSSKKKKACFKTKRRGRRSGSGRGRVPRAASPASGAEQEVTFSGGQQFDEDIDRKASKANITVRNAKTIIRKIISNEQVRAMMQYAVAKEADPQAQPPTFTAKMTRSRTRQLQVVDTHLAALPVTPVKRVSLGTEQLAHHEFPDHDNDDDEEYTPRKQLSECSSAVSSPAPSTPSVRSATPAPATPGSGCDEPLSLRTRSRLPLTDQALEELEKLLVAPDVTPDMYAPVVDDDDWAAFLRDFSEPFTADVPDDEEDDEYVFQLNEEEENEREELRGDPAARISQKEVTKLVMELFKDVNDLQCQPDPAEPTRDAERAPSPTQAGTQGMTASQARQLDHQMTAHVQLLAQTYAVCAEYEWLQAERAGAAALLVELNGLSSALKAHAPATSFFCPANLAPALLMVARWDTVPAHELMGTDRSRVIRASDSCHCRLSDRLVDTILDSTAFVFPHLLPTAVPVVRQHEKKSDHLVFPCVDQLIAMGLEQFTPYARAQSRRGRTNTSAVCRLIEQYMMPVRASRIHRRIQRMRSENNVDNPIMMCLERRQAPPVPRITFLPHHPLRPLRPNPRELIPPWCDLARLGNAYFSMRGHGRGQLALRGRTYVRRVGARVVKGKVRLSKLVRQYAPAGVRHTKRLKVAVSGLGRVEPDEARLEPTDRAARRKSRPGRSPHRRQADPDRPDDEDNEDDEDCDAPDARHDQREPGRRDSCDDPDPPRDPDGRVCESRDRTEQNTAERDAPPADESLPHWARVRCAKRVFVSRARRAQQRPWSRHSLRRQVAVGAEDAGTPEPAPATPAPAGADGSTCRPCRVSVDRLSQDAVSIYQRHVPETRLLWSDSAEKPAEGRRPAGVRRLASRGGHAARGTASTTPDTQLETPDIQVDMPNIMVDSKDAMEDTPDAKVDTPDAMVDTPDTQICIPDTQMDIPDTQMDIPDTQMDIPDTQMDIPDTQAADADIKTVTPDQAEARHGMNTTNDVARPSILDKSVSSCVVGSSVIELREEDGRLVVYIHTSDRPAVRVPVRATAGCTRLLLPPTLAIQGLAGDRPAVVRRTVAVPPMARPSAPVQPTVRPPTTGREASPQPQAEAGGGGGGVFKMPLTPHKPLRRVLPPSVTVISYPVTITGAPSPRPAGASDELSSEPAPPLPDAQDAVTSQLVTPELVTSEPAVSAAVKTEAVGALESDESSEPGASSAGWWWPSPGLEVPAMLPPALMTPRRGSPEHLVFGFPSPTATPAEPLAPPLPPHSPSSRALLDTPLDTPLVRRSPPAGPLLDTPLVRRSPPPAPHTPPRTDHPAFSGQTARAAAGPDFTSEQSLGCILDALLTGQAGGAATSSGPLSAGHASGSPAVDGVRRPAAGDVSKARSVAGSSGSPAVDGVRRPAAGDVSKARSVAGSSGSPAVDGVRRPAAGDGVRRPAAGDVSKARSVAGSSKPPSAANASKRPPSARDASKPLPAGGTSKPLPAGGASKPLPAGGVSKPLPAGGASKQPSDRDASKPTSARDSPKLASGGSASKQLPGGHVSEAAAGVAIPACQREAATAPAVPTPTLKPRAGEDGTAGPSTSAAGSTAAITAATTATTAVTDTEDTAQTEEDRELAALIAASTTVTPAGRSRPKRSRQQREAELTRMALAPESPSTRQRRHGELALQFYNRVRECVGPDIYRRFEQLLTTFDAGSDDEAALYDSVGQLLRGFPELASQFLGFLSPDVAVRRNCVTEHLRATRRVELARRIEAVNVAHPTQIQKVSRALTQLFSRSDDVSAAALRAGLQPLVRGCPLLSAGLDELIDSEPPAAALTRRDADFETAALDGGADADADADADDPFEEVSELTAGQPDPYGTDQCPCRCHERADDARFLQRRRHCRHCGLRFISGRVYLQTGKVLRPARVISCSEPTDAAAAAAASTADPADSPPSKRARRKATPRSDKSRRGAAAAAPAAAPAADEPPAAAAPAQTPASASTPRADKARRPPATPPAEPSPASTSASASPASTSGSAPADPAPWSRDDDLEILTACQRSGDGQKAFRAIQRRLPTRSVQQLQLRFQQLMSMLREQLQQDETT